MREQRVSLHGDAVIKRLRQEDGIALLLALAFTLILSTLVFGVIAYTTSNQDSARRSQADAKAESYAEAALDSAYARISYANTSAGLSAGLSPTKPTLLGCGTGQNGASDCTTAPPSPLCVGFTSSCPSGTYTATAGTGSVYGFFAGTSPNAGDTFSGIPEVASTWILVATGYSQNANGQIDAKTMKGTVTISAASAGAVASVWNHIFMTEPYDPNSCAATFAGNNMILDVPLYVIGNLCLTGQGVTVKEQSGGQPIDLEVGGKLVLSGSGTSVGDYSTSPATPITSGVVVGGCTTGTVTSTTSPCDNGTFRYSVSSTSNYVSQQSPQESATDMANDYKNFDPGPNHPCQTGGLATSAFDSSLNGTSEPDDSGSTTSGSAFELAPSGSDYTCISQSGPSTGQLTWNHSTHTLTINGSIFFDSNLTISSNVTYVGTAVIEVAGTITINGNGTQICAENTSCVFTNWQGGTGHDDMLTLVSLKANATPAIQFTNNAQTYQGSFWTQPSSTMSFVKNGVSIQGPMAIGGFDATFNNATFKPLPVIKNMPVGAPVPPNVSASISPLHVYG
jgi:Tfp pilus assembly protein PilX